MAKKILISSSSVLLCLLLTALLISLFPGQSPTSVSALASEPEPNEDLTSYTSVEELIDALLANGAEDADLPQSIYNLADTHWYAGRYEQARSLYKYIADNMADSKLAFKARAWVAGSDIKLSNFEAAQEEMDALIKDFAEHPELTTIIYKIADYYWYAGRYKNAKGLYQSVLDRDPQGDLAIWAKAWVAGSDIKLANISEAQQQIEVLIKDFDQHAELTTLIYKLADHYWYEARYQNARGLYQIVVDRDPQGELAIWASAWLAGLELITGNSLSSDQVLQTIVRDCAAHPNLAQMIYGIANGCWEAKKYEQAQQLYKYIADNMPNSNRGMRAKAWVAGADIMLGHNESARAQIDALINSFANDPQLPGVVYQLADTYCDVQRYQDGIHLYQLILDNWPHAKYAARAQFLIGNYYERLGHSGRIAQSQAAPKTEQAYEALIEKYPDSPDFKHAALMLAEQYFKEGQWSDAAAYLELLLQKYPPDQRPASTLYKLARAYDEMGQFDLAEQFYVEFIENAYPTDLRIEDAKSRLEELKARADVPRILTDTQMDQIHGAWERCKGSTLSCTFAESHGDNNACKGYHYSSCRQSTKRCQADEFGTEECQNSSIECGGQRVVTTFHGMDPETSECVTSQRNQNCPGSKGWCWE
jgi:TolA-binding protein